MLRSAAAAVTQRVEHELTGIVELEVAWGRSAVIGALQRATRFGRFKAANVRAILMCLALAYRRRPDQVSSCSSICRKYAGSAPSGLKPLTCATERPRLAGSPGTADPLW